MTPTTQTGKLPICTVFGFFFAAIINDCHRSIITTKLAVRSFFLTVCSSKKWPLWQELGANVLSVDSRFRPDCTWQIIKPLSYFGG